MNRQLTFKKVILKICTILSACLGAACADNSEIMQYDYPVLITDPVTEIDESGVVFNAEVLKLGKSEIIDHGFQFRINNKNYSYWPTFKVSLGPTSDTQISTKMTYDLVDGLNYWVQAYAVTCTDTVFAEKVIFKSQGSSYPVIQSFTPTHGVAGDTVILTGVNFGTRLSNSVITLDNDPATVLLWETDKVIFKVPLNATPGSYRIYLYGLKDAWTGDFLVDP